MIVYVYDGSFEGILTAIYYAYYNRESPSKILAETFLEISLLDKYKYIKTDINKAERVLNAASEKISKEAVHNAFYVYLSESRDCGTLIYNYFKLGFKTGDRVDLYLKDESVFNIHKLSRQILLETHRMLGLVRFIELKGEIYYSTIEPDNNILMLIAPHFKERLRDQNWIIHDTKRRVAAVYNKEEWILTDSIPEIFPSVSHGEELFQSMWREYYKSISIKERINPRLQKSYMPIRYWKNLVEKKLVP